MLRFVLSRLFLVIPTFLGIIFLTFVLIHLVPGDPVQLMLGEKVIDPARHATDNDQSPRRQLAAQPFRHLGSVQRRPARSHDADCRKVQNLPVAPHVQAHGRIVNLQQSLRKFRLSPVDQLAILHLAQRGHGSALAGVR